MFPSIYPAYLGVSNRPPGKGAAIARTESIFHALIIWKERQERLALFTFEGWTNQYVFFT
ncbi:MAG TPA: hypothetical protein DEV81_06230 [Cyanobacteria bacterium UBA11049]|nr:hypothetical protein [Cyanobacteria bacterium UBA11049]